MENTNNIPAGFEEYNDGGLDWGDEIQQESEFILLPPGQYPFEVVNFERARHPGSEKLPPCNKAVVSLKVFGPDNQTVTIPYNLFLHRKTEGMLSAFFIGLGMKEHGKPVRMDWNAIIGKTGWLKLDHRTFNNNTYHDIKQIIDPEKAPKAQAPAAPAGGFKGTW